MGLELFFFCFFPFLCNLDLGTILDLEPGCKLRVNEVECVEKCTMVSGIWGVWGFWQIQGGGTEKAKRVGKGGVAV